MRQITLLLVALLALNSAYADEPFNGRITRADGSGIKATVRVLGSNKSTRADGKGRFGLTNVDPQRHATLHL